MHEKEHSHHHSGENASRNIAFSFFLNLAFVFIEIAGALLTNSLAVFADAIHDFGDCISLGLSWILQEYSQKSRDEDFSYGYARLSLLSAVISGVIIAIGSLVIFFTALPNILQLTNRSHVPHGLGMLMLAIVGIGINSFAALKLSHGHSHNEKMLLWHFIEDVLGWVAVLVGSVFVYWKKWYWVDPLLAVMISVYVFWNVLKNLKKTVKLFLQSTPDDFDQTFFIESVKKIPGIVNIHDLHIWSLDGNKHILSLHIEMAKLLPISADEIKTSIRAIAAQMGNYHVTIELEENGKDCQDSCSNTLYADK